MSRLIALLSWYDEEPRLLARCVASLCGVADHVVALDGPYLHYPGALQRPQSEPDQREALLATADGARIGITLVSAREPWYGGEVQKRSALFTYGKLAGASDDWFLCIDADEYVARAPGDLRVRLAAAAEDVAGVTFSQRERLPEGAPGPLHGSFGGHRVLFRALPDLRVEDAHYFYVAGPADNPRILRGRYDIHELEPAYDASDLVVHHTPAQRPQARSAAKQHYYSERDRLLLERPVLGVKIERADGGQTLFNANGERDRVVPGGEE